MADSKTRKPKQEQVNLDTLMGTAPPQATEIEEAVLGAILVEPNCIDDAMDELTNPACFYNERNRDVFIAMRELYKDHQPVDIYTVTDKLRNAGKLEDVGGAAYLVELSSRVGAAAHIEYYIKVVKQKFIQRELITASYKILKTSYDDSVNMELLVDMAESEIYKATENNVTKDAEDIGTIINSALDELSSFQTREPTLSGVPSGFPSLDEVTMGWQASDLIILAARPSVGKTAFALNVAAEAAKRNYPVAIFSLEMPKKQLANRMMVSETGLDSKKFKGGVKLEPGDWQHIEAKIKALSDSPLYIDDTPSLPVMEFRSKVKKLVKQKKVKLVVVDYLQLMQGPAELRGMREQEVAAISRTLKATAKEFNVPIIALSQLSRNAVTRQGSNNRPQLSDLRESGSIEQDADMVLFIHRLDYQGLGGDEVAKGETRLIIAKHRNGEIGEIPLIFHDQMAKFSDGAQESMFSEPKEYQSAMNSGTRQYDYSDPTFDNVGSMNDFGTNTEF